MDKLHVAGNLRVDNNANILGNLSVIDVNAAGTGSFYDLSVSTVFSAPIGHIDDMMVGIHLYSTDAEIADLLTVGTASEVSQMGNLVYRNGVLFAHPAGNVGIGTTSPAEKLNVGGVVQSVTGGFMFPDNSVQKTAAPVIKHGTYGYSVSIGPYTYYTVVVTFGHTFSSIPTVTVTGANTAGNPAARLLPSVINPSPTGFTLVLYNTSSSGYSGMYIFNWIAAGN